VSRRRSLFRSRGGKGIIILLFRNTQSVYSFFPTCLRNDAQRFSLWPKIGCPPKHWKSSSGNDFAFIYIGMANDVIHKTPIGAHFSPVYTRTHSQFTARLTRILFPFVYGQMNEAKKEPPPTTNFL